MFLTFTVHHHVLVLVIPRGNFFLSTKDGHIIIGGHMWNNPGKAQDNTAFEFIHGQVEAIQEAPKIFLETLAKRGGLHVVDGQDYHS